MRKKKQGPFPAGSDVPVPAVQAQEHAGEDLLQKPDGGQTHRVNLDDTIIFDSRL